MSLEIYPKADRDLIDLMSSRLARAIEVGADLARVQCPVESGRLRGSIETVAPTATPSSISASVTADTPYAYEVETLYDPFLSTIGPEIARNI